MAADVNDWKNRLTSIQVSDWKNYIKGALNGVFSGQKTTQKTITPLLYYYYALNDISPINAVNVVFDVDHIIPQEKFSDNQMVDPNMKDSLTNLALLPKKDNISKGSKALNEITDKWLKGAITTYAGIEEKDFEKFSDITNMDDMKKIRGKLFLKTFEEIRTTKLSN